MFFFFFEVSRGQKGGEQKISFLLFSVSEDRLARDLRCRNGAKSLVTGIRQFSKQKKGSRSRFFCMLES